MNDRHVAVVGAGIVGITTAWYLSELGFAVTVFDQLAGPGLATSAANAGIVAPGYVTPWAAPGMPRKLASYWGSAESPVILRPTLDPAQWRWMARWLGECDAERYRRNRERMQRIARLGRDELRRLRASTGIDDRVRQGYLQLYRSERDLALGAPARAMLEAQGTAHALLDAAAARALEPALSATTPLAGALHLPDDESADCQRFCQALAERCAARGVQFRYGIEVASVRRDGPRVKGLLLARRHLGEANTVAADAVVVAAGTGAVPLLAKLGIRVPIYPVKGFSATVPIAAGATARLPARAVMDEAYKTAMTPLGDELRIAGTAEFGGHALDLRESALRTLRKVADDWFGPGIDFSRARYWAGARPMTPDGPPLIGATGVEGLYVNIGHGSTGWTMSCGTARVVSALVAGADPGIDTDGLTLARLANG